MKKMWRTPKGWLFSWVSKVVLICAFCFMLTCRTEAAVKLNKSNVNLLVRQTTVLKVTGTSQKVSWSSNRKAVASVNDKGKVIAKSPGTAQITAKSETRNIYVMLR